MALQGDLDSFALADVLRLLAGTTKTGRLAVTGTPSNGNLWLIAGELAGGAVDEAPHASSSEDVLFELMRLESGSFVFDDDEHRQDGGSADRAKVDDAIAAAEGQIAEWADVSAVVTSMRASVRMISELSGEGVTVTPDQWRVLAALVPQTTVADLGATFSLTDLVVSRQVKDLVESGLVVLGDPIAAEPAAVEVEAFDPTEPFDTVDEDADVFDAAEHFRAADHEFAADEVAMEDDVVTSGGFAEEALSNELSNAVEGSTGADASSDLDLLAANDGPVVLEHRDDAALPEPLPGSGTAFEGDLDGLGSVDGRSFESFEVPVGEEFVATQDTDDGEAAASDDDRGSLMRFLSSVEP